LSIETTGVDVAIRAGAAEAREVTGEILDEGLGERNRPSTCVALRSVFDDVA